MVRPVELGAMLHGWGVYLLVLPGNSSECPPPGNAEDDTVCLDLGKCKDGKCIPFCEREQHLESCACNGEPVVPRGSLAQGRGPPGSARPRASTRGPRGVRRSLPPGVQGYVETSRPLGSGPGSSTLSVETVLLACLLATFSDHVAGVGLGKREFCG